MGLPCTVAELISILWIPKDAAAGVGNICCTKPLARQEQLRPKAKLESGSTEPFR